MFSGRLKCFAVPQSLTNINPHATVSLRHYSDDNKRPLQRYTRQISGNCSDRNNGLIFSMQPIIKIVEDKKPHGEFLAAYWTVLDECEEEVEL